MTITYRAKDLLDIARDFESKSEGRWNARKHMENRGARKIDLATAQAEAETWKAAADILRRTTLEA